MLMPIIYHHHIRIIHLTKVCGFSPKVEVNNVLHSPKTTSRRTSCGQLYYTWICNRVLVARGRRTTPRVWIWHHSPPHLECVCSGATLGRCWTPVNPWWALYRHTLLVKDKPNRRREQRHRTETTALGTWKTYYALYRERPHTHWQSTPCTQATSRAYYGGLISQLDAVP